MTALILLGILGVVLFVYGMSGGDRDWAIGVGAIMFIVALVWLILLAAQADHENDQRLMAQCRKDKKEYECVGLLRQVDPTLIVIPVTQ